jgi:hypothetical protein
MSEDAGESVKASSSCGGVARTKVNFQSRLILEAIFKAELDQPWRHGSRLDFSKAPGSSGAAGILALRVVLCKLP